MKTKEHSHPEGASDSPSFSQGAHPGVAADLSEDAALALLTETNLTGETLASLARTAIARKSRKVAFALLFHARTPRHLSIPLLRRMFTFDLMKVALTPQLAADLKRAAEEQILVRLEALTVGEKISLARRASAGVVAGLLADSDGRVLAAALGNSHLREASIRAALHSANAPAILFEKVSEHPTWSQNRELQIALLASEKTPIQAARRLAKHYSPQFLEQILPPSRRSAG